MLRYAEKETNEAAPTGRFRIRLILRPVSREGGAE
jgi:hypothetical protein